MMTELSSRLQAVADLVTPGAYLADIGTDHAYIPIYLTEQNRIRGAIAMDINKGPLERAKEHIREHGLEEKIQTRLSDGLKELRPGEADAMIAAGMGGALVIKILEEGKEVARGMKELILQPQSELAKVRAYLLEQGYEVLAEDMVLEDGKYYPMMKVHFQEGKKEVYNAAELEYGKGLLKMRHPVLKQFLDREAEINQNILVSLKDQDSERARMREQEIEERLTCIEQVIEHYF